jgi:aryl-alcohol dehydrogenase-like predicted oxidoreductase
MEYVNLGRTGLKISRLSLGCMTYGIPAVGMQDWTLNEEHSRPFYRRALELGINFFDTANAYSNGTSEEITGRSLKDFARRDEVVVATKAYAPWRHAPNTGGLSRKALFAAVNESLRRLAMDYIDLFQIHRWDFETPIEETMEALHDIVRAGKALYIGASSMYAWQFQKAQYVAQINGWTKFISMQNHVNLLYREEEREMIPLCIDQGVGVIPWSPLARGRLTRNWNEVTERSESDSFGKMIYAATVENDRKIVEAVAQVATARSLPRAQIALAWLAAKPGITAPIIGASKPHHLEDAVAALSVRLTEEEIAALESLYVPHPVVGLAAPRPFKGRLSSP